MICPILFTTTPEHIEVCDGFVSGSTFGLTDSNTTDSLAFLITDSNDDASRASTVTLLSVADMLNVLLQPKMNKKV